MRQDVCLQVDALTCIITANVSLYYDELGTAEGDLASVVSLFFSDIVKKLQDSKEYTLEDGKKRFGPKQFICNLFLYDFQGEVGLHKRSSIFTYAELLHELLWLSEHKMSFNLFVYHSNINKLDVQGITISFRQSTSLYIEDSVVLNLNSDSFETIDIKTSEVHLKSSILYNSDCYEDTPIWEKYIIDNLAIEPIMELDGRIRDDIYKLQYLITKHNAKDIIVDNLILSEQLSQSGLNIYNFAIANMSRQRINLENSNLIAENSLLEVVAFFQAHAETLYLRGKTCSPVISLPAAACSDRKYIIWTIPSIYYPLLLAEDVSNF